MADATHVPRRIILDCDPGHDDALAILLAHGCPELELAAITTVAGNQTLERTTLNARRVCSLAGIRDVPVAAGRDRPLRRPLETAADIHGASGLDGPTWDEPDVGLAGIDAVELIVELVMASEPGELTLVPIGPLTNVAAALEREPRVAERVREIVLMGGAYTRGNRTPTAEFNVWVDPEAAARVFAAGAAVTMVGLDLTHQALATPAVVDRIAEVGTRAAQVVVELLAFYGETNRRSQGFAAPPVHDPCAVARVAQPELVAVREAAVAVATEDPLTRGTTVVDFHVGPERPPTAWVATELDVAGFWDLFVDALRRVA